MLQLRPPAKIAGGKLRDCYMHPQDDNLVVKVACRDDAAHHRANLHEWRHYQYLSKRHGPLNFIPRYFGLVPTSLGQGLVVECIRNADGVIAPTLHALLTSGQPIDFNAVIDVLNGFCSELVTRNIQLFDLNLKNIAMRIAQGDRYQPVAIDLKGRYNNYEFIPVSSFIPFFSKRKLIRRSRQLLSRVHMLHSS